MENYTKYYYLINGKSFYVTIDQMIKGLPNGTTVYYTHSQKAIAHQF